jgi:hypothetical protein
MSNPNSKIEHEGIKSLLSQRRLGNDANQLLNDIMDRWGGPKSFAESLYREFLAANEGSLIRQNILEMIQKLVVNNTNHNITRIVDPSDLDDEEIEGELNVFISRASGFQRERMEPRPKQARSVPTEEKEGY